MYLFVIYALFVNVYNMSGVQQNRRLEVSKKEKFKDSKCYLCTKINPYASAIN
jgi:hypothetical protein